jgi:hypothetical protein
MRGIVLAVTIVAGCSFSVPGVDTPTVNPSGPGLPPSSVNATDDLGTAPVGAPAPDLATPIVGGPCATDADCGGLHCVVSAGNGDNSVGFSGGYCTTDCSASACPTGSTCADVGNSKLCLATCPPASCRTGYSCCGNVAACTPSNACD